MREYGKERAAHLVAVREKRELEEAGWHSTGEIPYTLAQTLRKSSGSISTVMYSLIKEKLGTGEIQYGDEQIKRAGKKVYVSPALEARIEEHVKRSFGLIK